jgi:hypothetical protein
MTKQVETANRIATPLAWETPKEVATRQVNPLTQETLRRSRKFKARIILKVVILIRIAKQSLRKTRTLMAILKTAGILQKANRKLTPLNLVLTPALKVQSLIKAQTLNTHLIRKPLPLMSMQKEKIAMKMATQLYPREVNHQLIMRTRVKLMSIKMGKNAMKMAILSIQTEVITTAQIPMEANHPRAQLTMMTKIKLISIEKEKIVMKMAILSNLQETKTMTKNQKVINPKVAMARIKIMVMVKMAIATTTMIMTKRIAMTMAILSFPKAAKVVKIKIMVMIKMAIATTTMIMTKRIAMTMAILSNLQETKTMTKNLKVINPKVAMARIKIMEVVMVMVKMMTTTTMKMMKRIAMTMANLSLLQETKTMTKNLKVTSPMVAMARIKIMVMVKMMTTTTMKMMKRIAMTMANLSLLQETKTMKKNLKVTSPKVAMARIKIMVMVKMMTTTKMMRKMRILTTMVTLYPTQETKIIPKITAQKLLMIIINLTVVVIKEVEIKHTREMVPTEEKTPMEMDMENTTTNMKAVMVATVIWIANANYPTPLALSQLGLVMALSIVGLPKHPTKQVLSPTISQISNQSNKQLQHHAAINAKPPTQL